MLYFQSVFWSLALAQSEAPMAQFKAFWPLYCGKKNSLLYNYIYALPWIILDSMSSVNLPWSLRCFWLWQESWYQASSTSNRHIKAWYEYDGLIWFQESAIKLITLLSTCISAVGLTIASSFKFLAKQNWRFQVIQEAKMVKGTPPGLSNLAYSRLFYNLISSLQSRTGFGGEKTFLVSLFFLPWPAAFPLEQEPP